jgi:hypothetical protein
MSQLSCNYKGDRCDVYKTIISYIKAIFNELYQALNMKKIMKKYPLRKFKFTCPFFISGLLSKKCKPLGILEALASLI